MMSLPTPIGAQNLSCFRILFDVFDNVDQVGDFREEWVIVGEANGLLAIVAWPANIEDRLNVWVDKPGME